MVSFVTVLTILAALSDEPPSTTVPRATTDVACPKDITGQVIDGDAVDGALENENEDIEEELNLISRIASTLDNLNLDPI